MLCLGNRVESSLRLVTLSFSLYLAFSLHSSYLYQVFDNCTILRDDTQAALLHHTTGSQEHAALGVTGSWLRGSWLVVAGLFHHDHRLIIHGWWHYHLHGRRGSNHIHHLHGRLVVRIDHVHLVAWVVHTPCLTFLLTLVLASDYC